MPDRASGSPLSPLPEGAAGLVFEASPHGIVFQGAEGVILLANPAAERILGLTPDQLKGRTCFDPRWHCIREDGSPLAGEEFPAMRALQTGQPCENLVMGVVNPVNSVLIWVQVSARPLLRDGGAKPHLVMTTFVDITEQKVAEDQLRQSRTWLQRAERVARFGNWELDLARRTMHASQGARRIYGLQGRTWSLEDIQELVLPEDRARLDLALLDLIHHNQPYALEFSIRRASDGEIRTIRSEAEYDPAKRTVFGVIHDVTDRKRAEEALVRQTAFVRSVFDAEDSHLAVLDATGLILDVNSAWRRFAIANGGNDETAWGVGANYFKAFSDLGDQTCAEAAYEGIRRVQRGELASFEIAYPCPTQGAERWFTLRVLPVGSSTGTVLVIHRDETDRNLAQAALRESEERFNAIFQFAPVALGITTVEDGRFLAVNEAFQTLYGYRSEELLGRSSTEFGFWVNPEDRRAVLALLKAGQTVDALEIQVKPAREGLRWVSYSGRIVNMNGTTCLLAGAVDITKRKDAEEALRASEARYRMLSENAGDVIWLLNLETQCFEYVSPSVEGLRGYSVEEVMKQTREMAVTPDSAEAVQRHFAERIPRFRVEDPSTWTYCDRIDQPCKDGSVVTTEVTTRYLANSEGKVNQVLGVSRDITERIKTESALRASEERFQKAFRSSPVMMSITDMETGRFLELNDCFCAASGYSREEAIGKTTLELGWISPRDRERLLAALTENGHATGLEFQFRNRSGDAVSCVSSAEIVEFGGSRCLLNASIDISELKRNEEQRKALETQVHHLHRMESVGRLAGGIAHDMNNVLSAILGMAELQQMEFPEGTRPHARMATIAKACARGRTMLRGLLDFARNGLANEAILDLNGLVEDEMALLERTMLQRVSLEMDLEQGLRPVKGDPVALSHVLMNLCLNAVDAMPEGGTLTLRTRNHSPREVLLEVVDTGGGMSPEVLGKAMEPFYSTKAQGKGTGLGLSIVYGTVKAHNGLIDIQSTPGHGTSVSILLPVSLAGPGECLDTPGEASAGQGLRVLLVDDDELIQQSTGQLLEALGHAPTVVDCGEVALSRLERGESYDLVILDMNMPGLGGAETLLQLRRLCPGLPVLLATGRVDQQALQLVESVPHVKLMGKPFALKDLKQHLADLG